MFLALLLAAALPAATPNPAVAAKVDAWTAAADEAAAKGNASEAAANLWRAGEAADRELRDYDRALALYGRLVHDHPAARLTRGAMARRDYVAKGITPDPEPFRRFERVRADFAKLDRGDARAEVRELVERFPKFAYADEALLWIGDRATESEDTAEARKAYETLLERFPDSPLAAHAWAGLGRAAFAAKDWDAAEAAFARIANTTVAGASIVSAKEVDMVRRHRIRAVRLRWVLGFLAVAAVAAAASVDPRRLKRAARASLGRELLYAAPIFALVTFLAPADGRGSLAAVAATFILFLWLTLIWADAARPALARPGLRALSTIAATITGVAIVYVLLYALDLLIALERLIGEA